MSDESRSSSSADVASPGTPATPAGTPASPAASPAAQAGAGRRRLLAHDGAPSPASRRLDRLYSLRHWRDASWSVGEAGGSSSAGSRPTLAPDDMRALVDAARQGDRSALDDLVRATYGGTYTLAYRLTGNEDDARDVVQDAYLRAYRGLRRFRGDAQFTTWLYRITANCSANLLAKRARHRTESLADDEPVIDLRPENDPERRLAGSDERARIAAALAQLPWRLRQVIVLRDIYDLAHGAIAKELGITEAAAKVRLHRARRRLRDLLAAEGTDAGAGYAVRTDRDRPPAMPTTEVRSAEARSGPRKVRSGDEGSGPAGSWSQPEPEEVLPDAHAG